MTDAITVDHNVKGVEIEIHDRIIGDVNELGGEAQIPTKHDQVIECRLHMGRVPRVGD
jgi:hypothetical protein